MNRSGLLQSTPVQQMMTGNPTWWNINSMRPPNQPTTPFFSAPSNPFPPYAATSSSIPYWNEDQDQLPESWSQLLMGGLVSEEAKVGMDQFQSKKLENWGGGILFTQASDVNMVNIKQENSGNSYSYGLENQELQAAGAKRTWSSQTMSSVSSPTSCVTGFSSNLLDFANKTEGKAPPSADLTSECNSSAAGGAGKKPRVQPTSSTETTTAIFLTDINTNTMCLVRKEKLGDRITTLHQLVSPFGKTDTASVLLEAIGYIRFLQSQIEALSLPYLGSGSAKMRQQQSVQGERNGVFSEDPGKDPEEESKKDLRSRGLCLVPVSCTLQVGSDNGADYWAPALGGVLR